MEVAVTNMYSKPILSYFCITHFNPGMSNKLVNPVQLMSSFCQEITQECTECSKSVQILWKNQLQEKQSRLYLETWCLGGKELGGSEGTDKRWEEMGRTGRWMKNMVTAPTMGTSPIRGSRITRIIPDSYRERERQRGGLSETLINALVGSSVYWKATGCSEPITQLEEEENRPVFPWLLPCRSTFSPRRLFLRCQRSWGNRKQNVTDNESLLCLEQ